VPTVLTVRRATIICAIDGELGEPEPAERYLIRGTIEQWACAGNGEFPSNISGLPDNHLGDVLHRSEVVERCPGMS
jgi:hypothetical protein